MKLTPENTRFKGVNITVFVNQVEIDDVVEANIDEGYIICYLRDRTGELMIDETASILKAKIHGKVEVRLTKA